MERQALQGYAAAPKLKIRPVDMSASEASAAPPSGKGEAPTLFTFELTVGSARLGTFSVRYSAGYRDSLASPLSLALSLLHIVK